MSGALRLTSALVLLAMSTAASVKDTCPTDDPFARPGQLSGGAAFSYSRMHRNGPSRWGRLDCASAPFRRFRMCSYCAPNACNGSLQSPIALSARWCERRGLRGGPRVALRRWARVRFAAAADGFGLKCASAWGCGGVRHRGEWFAFVSSHVHSASEHRVGGRSAPLEMHFVHRSANGRLLVVARLFERAPRPSHALQQWLDVAARKRSARVNLRALAGYGKRAFVYVGGLTTPPCTEGVTFVVKAGRGAASTDQIRQVIKMHGGKCNNRPLQRRNGRTVTMYA